jgi:putative transposase
MKLVANIKLRPDPEQFTALKETLENANAVCNWISEQAWERKVFQQFRLHQLIYKSVRQSFNLSAQMVVRSIGKVSDAYKSGRNAQRKFRKHAAQPYDDRIFRIKSDTELSIWSVKGRLTIPYECGEHQRRLLVHRKGEVDLMLVNGVFYVACVCDIDDPKEIKTRGVLGVDFGIVNIATDSEGNNYSGEAVEKNRRKFTHRRKNLQKKGTPAAKRKLRQISGKQSRFQKNTNHCIAKGIVQTAQRYDFAIALEDLTGIRDRIKARRRQRGRLHNWQFAQLRIFISYKAILAGIPVVPVDPRNSSRECPECGHIAKSNRKNRDNFLCVACGFAGPADAVAALNLRARGLVNDPMVRPLPALTSSAL